MKAAGPPPLQAPCPCSSGARYAACCGRWHAGGQQLQAPSAEALMRSRYSAYVLGLADYLLQTWHPRTRPAEAPRWDPRQRWLGLELRRHTLLPDGGAVVEFVARSKLGGRATRHHECSRFVHEHGRWFYVDAEGSEADSQPGG